MVGKTKEMVYYWYAKPLTMKTLSLFIFFLICFVHVDGQEYIPFPTANAEWIIRHTNAGNGGTPSTSYYSYAVQGDTLVNDTLYHRVLFNTTYSPNLNAIIGGFREENKRVYFRSLGNLGLTNVCVNWGDVEYLIYDFNIDEVGDSLYLPTQGEMSLFVAQSIDSIWINNSYRTRWTFMPYSGMCQPFWYTYIEGVGSDRHPFGHIVWMTQEISDLISCMTIDGQFEYSAFSSPPLCDLADFVGVDEPEGVLPDCYMHGTTLVFDPSHDWIGTRVQLFSINGQCISEWTQPQLSFDLSQWPAGLYMVRMQAPDGSVATRKVVR